MQSQIIIQARMGSARLPGKSLMPVGTRPLLGHLLDAVRQLKPSIDIAVVTSNNSENKPLVDFCKSEGVDIFCGDEVNVASRFNEVLKQKPQLTHFVRLSGDSPLMDYRVIELCLNLAGKSDADLVSTAVNRAFPSGCNVEVVKAQVFLRNFPKFSSADHFEHVTKYFYEQGSAFRIEAVKCELAAPSRFKFSVDTSEDLERIRQLFQAFSKPHYEYSLAEKCQLAEKLALF